MNPDRHITLNHGAGGTAMRTLITELFVSRFGNAELSRLNDGARVTTSGAAFVFTTDSFVVNPPLFPGGDIGRLSVCGTVNDLLVMGARPRWLSVAMILEEGLPLDTLETCCDSIVRAAHEAEVEIVTGDTKVVSRGQCDRLYITTAGIGESPLGHGLSSRPIEPGDAIIVSGEIGDHAVAVFAARNTLAANPSVESDCAPLLVPVREVLTRHNGVKWMRDPTRGGIAACLDELSAVIPFELLIREQDLPVSPGTRSYCELLGFDPMHLASEGRVVMIVDRAQAPVILRTLQATKLGARAAIVGEVRRRDRRGVLLETAAGGIRRLHRPSGELLPRIC